MDWTSKRINRVDLKCRLGSKEGIKFNHVEQVATSKRIELKTLSRRLVIPMVTSIRQTYGCSVFLISYKYMEVAHKRLHTTQKTEAPTHFRKRASHQKKYAMISPKRLVQQLAALGKWRLTTTVAIKEGNLHGASAIADKGHCIVYTAGGERFEVPLSYLGTTVFGELLRMSEDEFGFTSEDSRITVPCDAAVMAYVMCLLRRKPSEEVERAVLSSVVIPCSNQSGATMVYKGLGQSLAIF
jgi:hypothetical protein